MRKAGKMLTNIERQYSIELFYCHHRAVANIGAFIATILQGFHSTGDGRIFLKISASHSLMTYRMNLISARSISLDITFKFSNLLSVTRCTKEKEIYLCPNL
jgi:hypothetical protein